MKAPEGRSKVSQNRVHRRNDAVLQGPWTPNMFSYVLYTVEL